MNRSDGYSDDTLVAVKPGAELIGVHPDTLRRYADDGLVPYLRTPTGARRFRVGDLRNLLTKPEQPDADTAAAS